MSIRAGTERVDGAVFVEVRREISSDAEGGGEVVFAPRLKSRFDGKYVWTSTDTTIFRIDLAIGQRETITEYGSGSPKQSLFTGSPILSADGRAYAYTYGTVTSDLHVVEGARTSMR